MGIYSASMARPLASGDEVMMMTKRGRSSEDVEHLLVVRFASMADTANPETYEEIVNWAYRSLPQKIRDLPDFPGIQAIDEPPADVCQDTSHNPGLPRYL
jgi:hypothetical protein